MTFSAADVAVLLGAAGAVQRLVVSAQQRTLSSVAFAGAAATGTLGAYAFFEAERIDHYTHTAGAGVLTELLAFIAATTALNVYVQLLVEGPDSSRPLRRTIAGAGMGLLLVTTLLLDPLDLAGPAPRRLQPDLTQQILLAVIYAYIVVVLVRASTTALRLFARHHDRAPGLLVIALATLAASGAFVIGAVADIGATTHPALAVKLWTLQGDVSPTCIGLLGLGILSLPVWQKVSTARTARTTSRALEPLWRDITRRVPGVVLDRPLPRWGPAAERYRAHRYVTEVLDALAQTRLDLPPSATTHEVAAALLAWQVTNDSNIRTVDTRLRKPHHRDDLLKLAQQYAELKTAA